MENFVKLKEERCVPNFKHLRDGIKPIMACLEGGVSKLNTEVAPNLEIVDLYAGIDESRSHGFKKEGEQSYIISPVNSRDKFSHAFLNCTGVVVVGLENMSGRNISFMSHQNPDYFLHSPRDKKLFVRDLRDSLKNLKEKCAKGTIDVVIFGGRYSTVRGVEKSSPFRNIFIEEYVDSIELLSKIIHIEFGFYPNVITGPKLSPSEDSIRFKNESRRLFVLRSSRLEKISPDFLQSFNAQDIEKVRKTWNPGEWGPTFSNLKETILR